MPCNVRCPHGRGLRDRQERQLARQTGRGGGSRHAGPGARTSPAGGCTAGSSAWSFTPPWGRKGQAGDGGLGMKGKKPQFAACPLPGRHGRLHSGHLSSRAGGVGPWRLSCGSPAASALVTSCPHRGPLRPPPALHHLHVPWVGVTGPRGCGGLHTWLRVRSHPEPWTRMSPRPPICTPQLCTRHRCPCRRWGQKP